MASRNRGITQAVGVFICDCDKLEQVQFAVLQTDRLEIALQQEHHLPISSPEG